MGEDAQHELQRLKAQHAQSISKNELQAQQECLEQEASRQRSAMELSEYRFQHSVLEERQLEISRSREHVVEEYQESQAQAAELTWRLETTNGELKRSRSAVKSEQEKGRAAQASAQRAKADLQQSRHALEIAESSKAVAEENLRHRQGEATALSELLTQARRYSSDLKHELEQMREEAKETSLALEAKSRELRQETDRVRDMETQAVQLRATAAIQAEVAESRGQGAAEERVRAAEAAAALRVRELEVSVQEKVQAAEAAAAARLREVEDKHLSESAVAASSVTATIARYKSEEAETSLALNAACRMREAETEAAMAKMMEAKVEQTKTKYEQKISKLYKQLNEREAYEDKLKAAIENEIDTLHGYNQDADHRAVRKTERHIVEDYVVDRMKGIADKVERRILRGLRHPDRRY